MGYLDKAGLSRAFTKLKTLIDNKADVGHTHTKNQVGLGNVDNTADANKSVKYATSAGSASTATTADRVANTGAASANAARHVWFSDSETETARVSDDNFKYNPSGNLLTTNISGNAATASSVDWENVSGKPSAFAPASHTHDDRYYTESEINTKLNAKANSSHTHTKSQITDFPTSMPASDVYSWAKQSSKPSYSASEVGAVPTSRKVNGKDLSSDISLSAGDVGAAPSSHSHNYAGSSSAGGSANWANGADYANYAFSNNGVSTSGDGSAYTATVSGFSLDTGKSIVIIPNVTSTTTTPTLNVSDTGANSIRMRLSSSTSSTIPLINSSFLTQYKPVKVTYDGTYWVIDDFIQPDANNLYGTLISSGSSEPSNGTAGFIYIQTT